MDPELLRHMKILAKLGILVLFLVCIYLLFTYVFPIVGDLLIRLPSYVMPFLLALVLAVLIEPVVGFLEKKLKLGRGAATLTGLLLVLGGLGFLVFLLVSRLIVELIDLYKLISSHSTEIGIFIVERLQQIKLFYGHLNLPPDVEKGLEASLYRAMDAVQGGVSVLVNYLIQFVAGLPGLLVFFLIATVATYFITKERSRIRDWVLSNLPQSWEGKTQKVIRDLIAAFLGFIKAEVILVSITGLQTVIGLKILGVEYALTIGLLTGLFDILPVVGPGTIMIPWLVFELAKGNTGMGIGLLVLYVIIVAVRQILEPRIIGDNVGLHPLATLISLYVGLKMAGIVGMILGPVLVILFLSCRRAGVFEGLWFNKKTW